jgi:hypothetical protein
MPTRTPEDKEEIYKCEIEIRGKHLVKSKIELQPFGEKEPEDMADTVR